MEEFLERTYFDNTVQDYLIAAGLIILGFLVIRIFRNIVISNLKKVAARTDTSFDDLVIRTIERFGMPALNFLVIFWGISTLTLSEKMVNVVKIATAAVVAFFLIRLVSTSIQYMLENYVRSKENGEEKVKQIKGVTLLINVGVWAVGLIFLFDNLGYDVTAIIAGLGIGGIAIALAAQNILGDLFNYFVIFFDQPFEVGDFIIVDDKLGTVEHIGIKTTRVKSLSGEQIVFSNSDLTNSRIHNYKRMQRRRIVFAIGVIYQTTSEQLKEVPQIIRSVIDSTDNATLDRVHFKSYGNFSLDFETVYFVESAEYNVYMDIQQKINLEIFTAFESRGIEFAYPTQTLFLNQEAGDTKDENPRIE